ncbi:single-stranded DNA-binding protein [Desulfocurvibacter africanus]|uniref:Single-stranded DNA-binding protein n=1 Tax=Desulfocurvibacter africanus subsp. africanus str. Walvis Bay TaxID=690850 RepID=F3Z0I0_DESAF|nr:single-stranded DNA-binding protein [Desulfocurvibacter africanus]EGJ50990.1 single-strand binding protein [Desulfocurvibacter africanus subsp. africanus str. Walvis Bay]
MAGSMNKVILIGRLGQDPKLAYLPSGQAVVNARIATDESYKDQSGQRVDRTEWHNITVYGKQAEFVANYLHKGSLIMIEGSLRTRNYEKEGQKHYVTEVIAQRVQGLDSRRDNQGDATPQQGYQNQGYQNQQQPRGGQRPAPQQAPQYQDDDLGPAFPSEAGGMDDVPF